MPMDWILQPYSQHLAEQSPQQINVFRSITKLSDYLKIANNLFQQILRYTILIKLT